MRALVAGADLGGREGAELAQRALRMATRGAGADPYRDRGVAWNERPGQGRSAVVRAVGTSPTLGAASADEVLRLYGHHAALYTLAQNTGPVMTPEMLTRLAAEAERRIEQARPVRERQGAADPATEDEARDAGYALRILSTRAQLSAPLVQTLRGRADSTLDLGLASRADASEAERRDLLEDVIARERPQLTTAHPHTARAHLAEVLYQGIRGGLPMARVQELLRSADLKPLVEERHTAAMAERLRAEATTRARGDAPRDAGDRALQASAVPGAPEPTRSHGMRHGA